MSAVKQPRYGPDVDEGADCPPPGTYNRQEARRVRSRDAAQKRRDNLSSLLNQLRDLLPYDDDVKESFDKSTVLRLVVSYLRAKEHLGRNSANDKKALPPPESVTDIVASGDQTLANGVAELFLPALNGFLVVSDMNGVIVYVSENVQHHLGLFQHDLIGNSFYSIIHKDDYQELQDAAMTPLSRIGDEENLKYSFFCRMKCTASKMPSGGCKSPGYKVVHCSGRITTGKSFRFGPCLASTVCPVTPSSISEIQMRPGIFTTYNSMHLKYIKVHMNDTMQSLMGYGSEDLLGRSMFEFHHVGDMPMCQKCYLDLIAKGEGVSGYYRFLRRNGQWVWLQSRAAIMYNNKTARAEYIVVTNYVINQEEAIEKVASEGRCTNLSPGVFVPPNVPYPKHPPLDNPTYRAMAVAEQMLAEKENDASSVSQHESSPPQSSSLNSTFSPQIPSPASVFSPDSVAKQKQPNSVGSYSNSPADFSHMTSPSPSNSQLYRSEPSPFVSSWEPSPATDDPVMDPTAIGSGRFFETMTHLPEIANSSTSIQEIPDKEAAAVGFSDLQASSISFPQMHLFTGMASSADMRADAASQHVQSTGIGFPPVNGVRNRPPSNSQRQPVSCDMNKTPAEVAYSQQVSTFQFQPDHYIQGKPTMIVKPSVRCDNPDLAPGDGCIRDCSFPDVVGPVQAQTVLPVMHQNGSYHPTVEEILGLTEDDVLNDLEALLGEEMLSSGPSQMVRVSFTIRYLDTHFGIWMLSVTTSGKMYKQTPTQPHREIHKNLTTAASSGSDA